MKYVKGVVVLLLLCAFSFSATIRGSAYGPDLELLPKTVAHINTTPEQTYVAIDGAYSFEVPPGTYNFSADYTSTDGVSFTDSQEIVITSEDGDFSIDSILLPHFEENSSLPELDERDSLDLFTQEQKTTTDQYLVPVVVLAIILVGAIIFVWSTTKNVSKTEGPTKKEQEITQHSSELPEDLKEVLKIMQLHEGRITQKELRSALPLSEAKVSLMITDLEDRKLIRKIKKGRGNVLVIEKQTQ